MEPFYLIKYFNANYTRDKNQNFHHCSLSNHLHNLAVKNKGKLIER